MNPRIEILHATFDLNTRLFVNALAGVDDTVATTRPNSDTNHIAFIACHVLDARHYLAEYTGLTNDKPFKDVLEGVKGIEDIPEFPSLADILAAWGGISDKLSAHILELEDEALSKDSSPPFPIGNPTVLGGIAFLLDHESHHIGQLAYLRRYFGLPSLDWR
jgi:uncharacterized damage-inducible protein DinB